MLDIETLVVIDDDSASTDIIPRILEPLRLNVRALNSFNGAFELAKKLKPGTIVLDVMLGDGLGYQLSRQIRRDPELYKCSILFISSLSETPEVEFALNQGGDDYLVKPLTRNKFVQKIQVMQELARKSSSDDAVTGLATFEGFRREVEFRLMRKEEFAIISVKLDEWNSRWAGLDPKSKGLLERSAGQWIKQCLKFGGIYNCTSTYLSKGTYLVLCNESDSTRADSLITSACTEKLKNYVQGTIVATSSEETQMSARIAVTNLDSSQYVSEILMRVQNSLREI